MTSALDVRRSAQALITAKVNRSAVLDPLVAEAAREMPTGMIACLIAFIHAHTAVSEDVGQPDEMINYVGRSAHAVIEGLGACAAESLDAPGEPVVSELLGVVLTMPSEADDPIHQAAQALLGALAIKDLRVSEVVFRACIARCTSGAHLLISAMLDLVMAAIQVVEDHVQPEQVIGLLLERAEEIMSGLAHQEGCSVEAQVNRAWMTLEQAPPR